MRPRSFPDSAKAARSAALAFFLSLPGFQCQGQTITLFDVPSPAGGPMGIAPGFGHELWLTTIYSVPVDKICRITTTGQITCFDLPWICDGGALLGCYPYSIVAAPDGYLWFGQLFGALGRSTIAGEMVQRWDLSAALGASQVMVGADRGLWGTVPDQHNLFRVDLASGVQQYFATPTRPSHPVGITMAADGNMWFTEENAHQIGRLDPATGVITEYRPPHLNSAPRGITAGPDGNVWYVGLVGGFVGRVTPAGQISEFAIAQTEDRLTGICAGPDRNLWVVGQGATRVWRVNPEGAVTEFPIPGGSRGGSQITTGPDGNLWFTMTNAHKIGRVNMAAVAAAAEVPALSPPALAALGLAIALAAVRLLRR